ncbi:hypothetical protein [Pseudonocardia sp. ICBG601]|uniref:hypothetical protein n=1 Tax=Pseudonocardia sp. ICBG601 TaxID=2846759 RepID=UPI001CF6E16C|nr:hypothetical protein [Pseudonocardia sp. ICBG601]
MWLVEAVAAPFVHHVMMFHADGTMLQSNPDGGNLQQSDSIGMGTWLLKADDEVVGAFVECSANRRTGGSLGFTEVRFKIMVDSQQFEGQARSYSRGQRTDSGATTLRGQRLRLTW